MSQNDIKNLPGVMQIKKTKTVVIAKQSTTLPVYRVPLKYLYYNDQNDRISTEIVRYTSENNTSIPENEDEYNNLFEQLIVKSKEDAITRTQKSIANRGQDNPGVTLKDGRVVDGNRRFTCLRRIQRETNQEQFFETIILDYDYDNDYKYIKSLELELQMGVEEKVKYDPIDRLFGVYKSIRIEKAFTIEEYAALFDEYSVRDVEDDLKLADLMCEYLDYQNTPGKYYIAKDMNLEGILHEIPAVLSKVEKKYPDHVDDVKNRIFDAIAVGASSRLNLFVRDLNAVVDEGDLESLLSDTEDVHQDIVQELRSSSISNINDLADGIRSRDDLKEKLVAPIIAQKKSVESKKLKKAPLKHSTEALQNLSLIRVESINEMSDDDRIEFNKILEKIMDIVEEIRGLD